VRFSRGRLGRRHRSDLDDLESRLVWLMGGPRTGSTWLLDLLVYPLTPDSNAASGAAMRSSDSTVRPGAVPINEPYLGVHLAPIVSVHFVSVFTPADVRQQDPSYFFDDRYSRAWRPLLRHMILERIAAQADVAGREHGLDRPLVVVKEPNGSEAAPMLMATLPRSRLLFLLRDGRDVLDSLLDAVSPGGWLAGGPDTEAVNSADGRLQFLRENALLWVHRVAMVQRAVSAHPGELTMTVRYEHLRADPSSGLREIADWLGLELSEAAVSEVVGANSFESYPASAKGRGKALRLASPGHWRDKMNEEEQAMVREVMGTTLAELGYEV
jgi:hypothetical protein